MSLRTSPKHLAGCLAIALALGVPSTAHASPCLAGDVVYGPGKVRCPDRSSCLIDLAVPGSPSTEPIAHGFDPGLLDDRENQSLQQVCGGDGCRAKVQGRIPDRLSGNIVPCAVEIIRP